VAEEERPVCRMLTDVERRMIIAYLEAPARPRDIVTALRALRDVRNARERICG